MMENALYIIGNGFDLAHGMPTRYGDFKRWLIENGRIDVIHELESAFPVQKDNEFLLWSDFEKALGLYDINKVVNWSWDDLYLTEFSIGGQIFGAPDFFLNTQIPDILNEAFTKWSHSIPLATTPKDFHLEKDAYYLTFNYTDTLEVLYGIPQNHILHIHGQASRNDKLIVGHNRLINPADYWDYNLDMRENNERMQRLTDMNDLRKPYYEILEHNNLFFMGLNHVRDIHIIGHSCAEVDYPYLQKIKESVDIGAIWHFTPYSNEDRYRINKLIHKMGIKLELTTGI